MTGSSSNSVHNTNEPGDDTLQILGKITQLKEIIKDEQTEKLKNDYHHVSMDLQHTQKELALQIENLDTLRLDIATKTNQISDLVANNTLQAAVVVSIIQAIGREPGIALSDSDDLIKDPDLVLSLIHQARESISTQKNPLETTEYYANLQITIEHVIQQLNKNDSPLKIMQTIDAHHPALKAQTPDAPGGFLLFLHLINQSSSVIDYWTDFQARYHTFYRLNPGEGEFKKNRDLLFNAIKLERVNIENCCKQTILNELKINERNNASQKLLETETIIVSNCKILKSIHANKHAQELEAETAPALINIATKNCQKIASEETILREQIEKIHNLANQILDDFITLFQSQTQSGEIFGGLKHAESINAYESNESKLACIKQAFDLLPGDADMTLLIENLGLDYKNDALSEKFANYLVAKKHVQEQLAQSELANEALWKRICEREELVIEFQYRFETYEQNRSQQYLVNDAFFSIEGHLRAAFIRKLVKQLEVYQQSGDINPVLKIIRNNIASFPGNNLQTILHSITIELLDFDSTIPLHFDGIRPPTEDLELLHENAQKMLEHIPEDLQEYADNIQNLYTKISGMRKHGINLMDTDVYCGDVVLKLADKLQTDVDHFIMANKDTLPNETSYAKFKEQFSARVHSQNDIMGKHLAVWKPILGNIMIGLLTLGVAIGIKLVVSKLSTGRASFFFEETGRQKQIASIDESLAMVAPAA